MPFSRYMELCLYADDPSWPEADRGYYARAREQFGKTGDFYTSSDVHAVFGRLLARQFEEMWRALGSPAETELIELGPGRGLFAQDVLDWSVKKFPDFHRALKYTLVERSAALRTKLEERFAKKIAAGQVAVQPDLRKDAGSPDTIIFANEFFDALPVEVIDHRGELRIDARNEKFAETFAPPTPEELNYLDHYSIHPEAGERVEASLIAQQWMKQVAETLPRGFAVIIDYGHVREEQFAGRHRGTVTAYRSHAVSETPYEAPGEQDITAHVNFTALRGAGEDRGLEFRGLVTQSQFLMGIGEANQFADAFEDCRLPQEHAKVALQLKHLVTPAGMGETFHVLVMSRGIEPAALSGLKWTR